MKTIRTFLKVMQKTSLMILLILIIGLASCKKEDIPVLKQVETFFNLQGENGFVGTLEGTNAYVSILLGSQEGIAFVCNGEENISEWFSGPINDLNGIQFTNSVGAKITVSFINNSFHGEMTFKEGTTFPFTATVNDGIYAGIYRVIDEKAEKSEIEAGWIVKSEDDQRGTLKINSRTLPGLALSLKNLEDISEGSSNTITINGASFSVFRYKVVKPPVTYPSPIHPTPIPYPNIHG